MTFITFFGELTKNFKKYQPAEQNLLHVEIIFKDAVDLCEYLRYLFIFFLKRAIRSATRILTNKKGCKMRLTGFVLARCNYKPIETQQFERTMFP